MVSKVSQSDFGGGLWRSGNRDRVPENASGELQEFLLGEDGLAFERGGATRKSNAALGAAGLLWLWDGYLAAGQRTVFGTGATTRVLDTNDASALNPNATHPATVTAPFRPVAVDGGRLMIPSGDKATTWGMYAGSRKTANYSTGTIATTIGSTAVVGTGTSWLANVDAGMLLDLPVATVNSNTSITLARPAQETVSGLAYTLTPMLTVATYPVTTLPIAVAIANRFIVVNYDDPSQLFFTAADSLVNMSKNDFHSFPGRIVGLGVLRDAVIVFTTAGVYAVSNMAYNLASATGDPQQRLELVNADLIAWGHEGIAGWSGALVVPARDGVWLIDSVSSPQKISLPVDDLYLSYVTAGHKPGVAEVFNGHYLLPILNASNVWQDTLVCRLTQTRSGPPFAWSRLSGADAQVAGFAERPGTPLLLAASLLSSSRVLDCTSYFAPAAGVKNDSDGSTRTAVWESREFVLSDMPTTVRRVRIWYTLTDAASDNPTVEFAYAKDTDTGYTVVANSTGTVQGTGTQAGAEGDGTLYNQWPVNKRAKGMRFRLRCLSPNAGFEIRQVELVVEAVQNP